ncbi:hypothetical protein DFH07DRAFT_784462 [Mycena maculata]|uniref:Uncharacterized protein n=1 Tax=Mycena maculata TaxID=230809 RepID=A0AAD7HGN7_9AGAR|nr:hypothetical protein DFH07DRAFT_784462 [Mycena maculata]
MDRLEDTTTANMLQNPAVTVRFQNSAVWITIQTVHAQGLGVEKQGRKWLGDQKDLKAALEKFQEAVDLTPTEHPQRASRLQGLAISLTDWYQKLGDLKDLEAAVEKFQEAVDLTPAEHS